MSDYPYHNQKEADYDAVIQTIQSSLGVDRAEAERRFNEGDWEGFNSTQAAREWEDESVGMPNTPVSIPYDQEEDIQGELKTASQRNVPPGVTPPQIVVNEDHETEKERKAREKRDDGRSKKRNKSKSSKK